MIGGAGRRGASNVGTYTHDVCAEFGSYLWLCIERRLIIFPALMIYTVCSVIVQSTILFYLNLNFLYLERTYS